MASNCPSMGKHIFSAIPLYQYPHYINLIHCCIYICLHQSHSIQVLIYIYPMKFHIIPPDWKLECGFGNL